MNMPILRHYLFLVSSSFFVNLSTLSWTTKGFNLTPTSNITPVHILIVRILQEINILI